MKNRKIIKEHYLLQNCNRLSTIMKKIHPKRNRLTAIPTSSLTNLILIQLIIRSCRGRKTRQLIYIFKNFKITLISYSSSNISSSTSSGSATFGFFVFAATDFSNFLVA